jgi:hypothetical protein
MPGREWRETDDGWNLWEVVEQTDEGRKLRYRGLMTSEEWTAIKNETATSDEQLPGVASAVSTGTDGRVIAFPARVFVEQNEAVPTSGTDFHTTSGTIPTTVDLFELNSLKENRFWRPKKLTRNKDYPKVILDGAEWQRNTGGFALRIKQPYAYLGYYRRETIIELEKEYGAKKPRKRKN